MAHQTTDDLQRGYEEVHNQLVASAKVVQLAHQINPDNKVGCMCAGFFAYPYTCDPNDFLKLQQETAEFATSIPEKSSSSNVAPSKAAPTQSRCLKRTELC